MGNKLQTRDQKLANHAVECVEKTHVNKEYRTVALGFPAMVMQAGLAQALGFLVAKNKDHHKHFLEDIQHVVKECGNPLLRDKHLLQQAAITCSLNDYRRLTRDVLDAAVWLKRFVQAKGDAIK